MRLKRATPQNIVIGGAAGAFPPMIGWAAATGTVGFESVLMFLIIFFWTPPHFWALSLWRAQDYARAGIPMLPVVAGYAETRRQILIYSLVLAPIGASPWLFGYAGVIYGATAIAAGAVMVWLAVKIKVLGDGDGGRSGRQAAVRLVDPLSLRVVRGALDRRPAGRSRPRPVVSERMTAWTTTTARRASCSPTSRSAAVARRSIAIALALGALVLLFYVVTIVKLGPGVLRRPL